MRLTACQRGLRVLCHGVAGLAFVAGAWLWVVAGGGGTWVLDLPRGDVAAYAGDGACACSVGKYEPRADPPVTEEERLVYEVMGWLVVMDAATSLHNDERWLRGSCADGQCVFAVTRWGIVPVILLAALPSMWLLRADVRRWHRVRTRHCVSCGYCLTGNQSGVCPECGAATPGMPAG